MGGEIYQNWYQGLRASQCSAVRIKMPCSSHLHRHASAAARARNTSLVLVPKSVLNPQLIISALGISTTVPILKGSADIHPEVELIGGWKVVTPYLAVNLAELNHHSHGR